MLPLCLVTLSADENTRLLNMINWVRYLQYVQNVKFEWVYLWLVLFYAHSNSIQAHEYQDDLAHFRHKFVSPPDSARPWVYWFWMNGNLSKEGITADLEAMKRVGIGGALIMDVSFRTPAGEYVFLSDAWRDLYTFAIQEAKRLGLNIIQNNDSGWTGSGGPWVKPSDSMQQITYSEQLVTGGEDLDITLPIPPMKLGYYQDIATYAVKTHVKNTLTIPNITVSGNVLTDSTIMDNNLETHIELKNFDKQSHELVFDFKQPTELQSISLNANIDGRGNVVGMLEASNDNQRYWSVKPIFIAHKSDIESVSFPSETARYFRLMLRGTNVASSRSNALDKKWDTVFVPKFSLNLSEINFYNTPRINNWHEKALYVQSDALQPDVSNTIRSPQIINISQFVNKAGQLQVKLPQGQWNIVRVGHTSTAKENHPPSQGGAGLEVSKLNKDKLAMHFDNFLGKLINDIAPLAGDTLSGTHIDSWEVKYDTWDSQLPSEFKARTGYDLLPYLPATVGQIVDSSAVSERFLWDFRRVLADVVADNYFGHLKTLSERHGMQVSAEAYLYGPMDTLQAAGHVDIPMNEFWNLPTGDEKPGYSAKQAASAAHAYGKKIVAAEAFTAIPQHAGWVNYPYALKANGDRMFARGTNRMIFHRWAMQPWLDRYPGMTFGSYGFNFERTLTWFEQSKAWLRYLQRVQQMLQSGQFVADYAVFVGETAPYDLESIHNQVTSTGYNFDYINQELLQSMRYENDHIVLPSGMRYKLLVLKNSHFLTLATLEKINELVEQGATILGDKPIGSPSLVGYPESDQKVKQLANKLWFTTSLEQKKQVKVTKKGAIHWNKSIAQVFQSIGLQADVSFNQAGENIEWLHRQTATADFYFLSLFKQSAQNVQATFRIAGSEPEFWNADTGEMVKPALWQAHGNGTTTVTFDLDPSGSLFVVFPKTKVKSDLMPAPIQAISPTDGVDLTLKNQKVIANVYRNGTYELSMPSGKTELLRVNNVPSIQTLVEPWRLSFPAQFGYEHHLPKPQTLNSLALWIDNSDENVRYFSGTGVYQTHFTIEQINQNQKTLLDLGEVYDIAQVKLNGQMLTTLWKPPYRVDVTEYLKLGLNQLEIHITNTWVNRLIGDAALPDHLPRNPDGSTAAWPEWFQNGQQLPKTGRTTFTTYQPYKKDSPLQPSGLLGPVKLIPYIELKIDVANSTLKR
ncbi:glycosyl hydrolase [Catenovulum agarivorans]|uniref:glycosyl hydrolase n=1 Tax=Catenovulum agarivorans TaxID=1172192 RepID=UPI000305B73D|nr:glycosyl hydrolase [Catenovulum agarivorans]